MPMNFTVPPDLEALVQKRLASGSFANVRKFSAAPLKLKTPKRAGATKSAVRSMRRSTALWNRLRPEGVYGPEEARQKLAAMRKSHLASQH